MGILNTTPNSFSDGGRYLDREAALKHAAEMVQQGADILDIGGESTAPGAPAVSVQQELDRTIPIIEIIKREFPIPISIDTSKPIVMQAAVAAGADLINDVCALTTEGALSMAAQLRVPVCLMHMQGTPRTMQINPQYDNVVQTVIQFLRERMHAAMQAGILSENLIVDPGFGFGKSVVHNLQLLHHLSRLKELGAPILVGLSRKTFIGKVLNVEVNERLYGSVAVAQYAVMQGARILRVHDVGATAQMVRMLMAIQHVEPLA